jgi:hypothetical protein
MSSGRASRETSDSDASSPGDNAGGDEAAIHEVAELELIDIVGLSSYSVKLRSNSAPLSFEPV